MIVAAFFYLKALPCATYPYREAHRGVEQRNNKNKQSESYITATMLQQENYLSTDGLRIYA